MRKLEDRLFERFRARGEPQALAGVFDRTAPELLRVAAHLAADRAAAEDLVQETFVLAIERAPSFDGSRRVRPWLLGILANLVRRQRRAARPRPDLGARVAPGADPIAAAAGAELRASVREAIAGLPACYRQVLVLHLQHGLNAKEIAEALDRPAGTVRTQVMRGLELLRKALPASLGAAASAAAPAGRGLAAVREAVVARAETGTAMAGSAAWMTVAGVWSMQKVFSAIAASALVAAATLGTMWAAGAFEAPRSEDAAPAPLRVAAEPPTKEPALPPNAVIRVPAEARIANEVEKPAPPGLSVEGLVVDEAGQPVAGAVVLRHEPDRDATELARTNAEGRFEANELQGPSVTLSSHAPNRQPSAPALVRGPPGTRKTVRLQLGPRGHRLVGRVLDPRRRPVPHAWVGIGLRIADPFLDGFALQWAGSNWIVFEERADGSGAFEIDWAPAGSVRVFAQPPGRRPELRATAEVHVEPDRENRVELQLSAQASVFGTLRESDGRGISGAVAALFDGAPISGDSERWDGVVRAGADGAFRIEGLLPGRYRLSVRVGARCVEAEVELEAGEERRWDPILEFGAASAVRVLDQRGAALAGWRVRWSRWSEKSGADRGLNCVDSADTGADGLAHAPVLAAGIYVVSAYGPMRTPVRDSRDVCAFPSVVRDNVTVPGGELVLRVPDNAVPSAPLVGRVLGPDGSPMPARLSLWRDGWRHDRLDFAADPITGRFEVELLTPGSFRLGAGVDDFGSITLHPVLLAGQTLDLGDVQLVAPAHIDVRLIAGDGGRLSGGRVLAGLDEWHADSHVMSSAGDASHWRSRPLREGTWRLYALADGYAPARCEVTLVAGEQRELALSLGRGQRCDLEIVFTEASAEEGLADGLLRVRDCAGTAVVEERLFCYFDEVPQRVVRRALSLAAGRYTVEAEDWNIQPHARTEHTFEVGDADLAEPVRVRIR